MGHENEIESQNNLQYSKLLGHASIYVLKTNNYHIIYLRRLSCVT